ncbi:MAG: NAD-dependent epimerase/dehydratase family protein [Saccharofermentanales bacterium]
MPEDLVSNDHTASPVRVLITGAGSYIGIAMEKRLGQDPGRYETRTLDMIGDAWRQADFTGFDVVFHVAGIVHKKESPQMKDLYFSVNSDLAVETAHRARLAGVKQFIFLSSMSVYGLDSGTITAYTPLMPDTFYGMAKLQAEERIRDLASDTFIVAILRPPMVYGKGCRGNYPKLAKIAAVTPVFPAIRNERSMIHIDNLAEFVRLLIDSCGSGLFFPQNQEYVDTSEMVALIAAAHGRKMHAVNVFNPLIRRLKTASVRKVFGSLVYAKELSPSREAYCVRDFEQSILLTEAEDGGGFGTR